jgi:Lysozyme like domain/CARDB/Carboxypeptidase regulatory-like domain/Divergent InlB B-repeat domain
MVRILKINALLVLLVLLAFVRVNYAQTDNIWDWLLSPQACSGTCILVSRTQVAQTAYSGGADWGGFRGAALVNAIAISEAESRFQLNAINTANMDGTTDYGLWQINSRHGYTPSLLLSDASYNARAAYKISNTSVSAFVNASWLAWVTFTDRSFVTYLPDARIAAQNLDSSVIRGASERIFANIDVDIRKTAGGSFIRKVPAGTFGTVLGSYQVAIIPTDPEPYPYVWWFIHWDDGGVDGWVPEDHLFSTQGGLRDLTIAGGTQTVTPATASAGSNVTIGASEFNSGNSSAAANTVYLYLSTNDVLTPGRNGDTYIGFIQFPSISANTSSGVISKSIRIPSNIASGTYFLFFWADGERLVNETNETNNFATRQLTVTSAQTANIVTSVAKLPSFGNVALGQSSATKSYTVSGSNLSSNLTVQAPAGFQISLNSSTGFANSLSLTQSGGSVPTTTIYARFIPQIAGTQAGNTSHVSIGATATTIANAATANAAANQTVNVSVSGTGGSSSCPSPSSIGIGQTINGTLQAGDCLYAVDNSYYDAYTFSGTAGQRIFIDMNSAQFDTYLLLYPGAYPGGTLLTYDNDSGGGTNARIPTSPEVSFQLPASGTYTILANSRLGGETGGYSLTLGSAGNTTCPSPLPISVGQTVIGNLNSSDCVDTSDGSYYDRYTFSGFAGQQIYIAMDSTQFNTYLYIYQGTYPGGSLLSTNNDGGGGTNARIPATSGFLSLPSTGTYTILANSNAGGLTGGYTLALEGCTYSITWDGQTVDPSASSASYGINTQPGCSWSAQSSDTSWLATISSGTGSGSILYEYTQNTSPFPRTATITAGGRVHTLTQLAPQTIPITVQTNPTGRLISVDGTAYSSPRTFNWISGESHSIGTVSIDNNTPNARYIWSNWSDGGAISHFVSPTSTTTYTANFNASYQVTINANPSVWGNVAPISNEFYPANRTITISATPNAGYYFFGWSGTGNGSYSGSNPSASITINGPITQTGNFVSLVPTAANAAISGRVSTASGRAISNATLVIEGGNLSERKYARTNAFGHYRFQDLEVGQTYIVSVAAKRYSFANPTRVITLNEDLTGEDFVSDGK